MAYSRRLGVIGILGVCFFVAVGCDDSEDKTTNDAEAGEGGESSNGGSGGKSTGGSQNNAGKGGKATGGTAGSSTAGKAGSVNGGGEGGAAGEGGASGDAGMAGESNTTAPIGGVGGAGGGGAGAGGAGGEPSGGAGGAPNDAPKCSYSCEIESDCQMVDAPPLHCDEVTKRCVDPRQVCDADDDCVPYLSNWGSACADDTGCVEGFEACVEWQGTGQCASLVDANNPEFPCVFGSPDSLPRFGAEGDVDVCIAPDPRCMAGACEPGCGDFLSGGCGIGNGDTCSAQTGLCECTQHTECDSGACGADGHCACVTSEDCQVPGRDTCQDGICVCGSAQSCPNPGFTNATALCE